MSYETGVEKVVRMFITLGVFVGCVVGVYFIIHTLFHQDWTLPNLSNHDFEWIVIFLLGFILFDSGCKCGKN